MPKLIWKEASSPTRLADPLIAAAHNSSTVFARWRQCACLSILVHPTHHPKRQLDQFSRFCARPMPHSLCATVQHHCSQNLPLTVRKDMDPHILHFFLGPLDPKRHPDESAVFPEFMVDTKGQTDRQNEHGTQSVPANYAVGRPKNLYSFAEVVIKIR